MVGNSMVVAPRSISSLGEHAGLVPGARHHNPFSEERFGFVPVELLPELHDIADHDDRWRTEPVLPSLLPQYHSDCPVTTFWSVRVPHWMSATGVSGLRAVGDQVVDYALEVLHAHEEHECTDTRRYLVPMHFRLFLGRVLVTGYKGNAGRMIPVRERDAGIGRHCCRSGHAGHDSRREYRYPPVLPLLLRRGRR